MLTSFGPCMVVECTCATGDVYGYKIRLWSTPRIDFSTLARALAVCAFTVPVGTPRTRAVSQTERLSTYRR